MTKRAEPDGTDLVRSALAAQGYSEEKIAEILAGLGGAHAKAESQSAVSQGGGAAATDHGIAVGGDVHGGMTVVQPGVSGAPTGKTLDEAYLRYLCAEVSRVTLSQIDSSVEGADPLAKFELHAVYTALLTTTPRGKPGREMPAPSMLDRGVRSLSALELLDLHPRLVLLGDPGSGKSTFVHFVALCQAGERVGAPWPDLGVLTAPVPGEEKVQPWRHGTLVPVRVILRDFAVDGLPALGEKATAEHLWQFIAGSLAAVGVGDYAPRLRDRLLSEGGLVLLDGLDEVPDAAGRRLQIREAVESFSGLYTKCRVLVTSRIYSYRSQGWRLTGFEEAELAPFSDAQIERFVKDWYAHAASRGRGSAEDAEGQARLLVQEIEGNPRLRGFAERPLLLTLMASLARARGRGLPDRRAKLYEQVVELLLDLWECVRYQKDKEGKYRLVQPSLSDWLKTDRSAVREVLEDLAFEAHSAQTAAEGTADIAEKDLVARLVKLAGSEEVSQKQLVKFLSERSGLLIARGVEVFTLPHRTFQEYLAACHLTRGSFPDEVAELGRQDPDRWREVVLLAAAKAEEGTVANVWTLARSLCSVDPESAESELPDALGAFLGGLALVESPRALGQVGRQNRDQLERLRRWHIHLLGDERFPAVERTAAGTTLWALGDPRFNEETWFLPKDPLLGFVEIQEGNFRMGEDAGLHEVFLPTFYMARWPVTVAQFRAFAVAAQYEGVPKEFLDRPGSDPVVSVNWHDALAYSRWLGGRLLAEAEKKKASGCGDEERERAFWQGLASGDLSVRLPSETEWEKSARGVAGLTYPWGERHARNRSNDYDSGVGKVSAVGCFPRGASPYGVEDLAGNVWEWTRSVWGEKFNYPPVKGDGREDRVLRGGAFNDLPWFARCAVRHRYAPADRNGSVGFRIVVSRSDLASEFSGF
ncbi:MAG: SUMF1/EgtB/PvdO family nonheme iron enzyme [Acidobacteriota bacterium]